MISVLIADDEQPAVDELAFLLGQDPRIGTIHQATSGSEAIRILTREPVDAAFLDIHMPGLSGFDLRAPPAALRAQAGVRLRHGRRGGALEAFDLAAVDYLLKPVRTERLQRSVTRVVEAMRQAQRGATDAAASRPEMIAVTLGATTRMIRRDDVRYVQAQGDYARLHTDEASYLARAHERPRTAVGRGRLRARPPVVSRRAAHVTRVRLGERPTVVVGRGAACQPAAAPGAARTPRGGDPAARP